MENPFVISGYVSPNFFCDRETETKLLIDSLKNGRNVTLISPRRMGKTGLIKNVFYQLQHDELKIPVFYMDIYSTQNLTDFTNLLANTVLGKLDTNIQKAIQRVSQFIKSCRFSFSFDELSGMPKVKLDIVETKQQVTIQEIFEYLSSYEQECYFAIDEFQQINKYSEKGVEALLRSFIQFTPNVHFIFSGSRRHLMQEMFLSPKRPFYQSTQLMNLDAIEISKYYHFANYFFKEQNIAFPESVFENLYREFEGHTWYIQMILNRLYDEKQTVNRSQIQKIISDIVSENEYAYQSLLITLPKGAIKLLKAIAKEDNIQATTSHTFITKYQLKASSSVSRSIKYLIDYDLVYEDAKTYTVYDRFMKIWLCNLSF